MVEQGLKLAAGELSRCDVQVVPTHVRSSVSMIQTVVTWLELSAWTAARVTA